MRPPMESYPWLLRSGHKARTWKMPTHFGSDERFLQHVDGYLKRLTQRSILGPYSDAAVRKAVTLELEDLEDRLEETTALLGHLEDKAHLRQLMHGRNPSTLFADRHVAPPHPDSPFQTFLHGTHEVGMGTYVFSHVLPFPIGFIGGVTLFGFNELARRRQRVHEYHRRLREFLKNKAFQRHVNVRDYLDNALLHKAEEGQEKLPGLKPLVNLETLMAFRKALERTQRLGEAYYAGLLHFREHPDRQAALDLIRARLESPGPRPARMDEELASRRAELAALKSDMVERWQKENEPAVRKSIQRQARKKPKAEKEKPKK